MSFSSKDTETSRDFVKQSSLYQEFLAEREEILRLKWLESERLGYDIGFEKALLDWVRGAKSKSVDEIKEEAAAKIQEMNERQ